MNNRPQEETMTQRERDLARIEREITGGRTDITREQRSALLDAISEYNHAHPVNLWSPSALERAHALYDADLCARITEYDAECAAIAAEFGEDDIDYEEEEQ
jgi:hypothetical protein